MNEPFTRPGDDGSNHGERPLGGHGFTARIQASGDGVAALATAYQPGWRCAVDGGAALPMVSWHGLLSYIVAETGEDGGHRG